ncbi:sulfite exporter TauE/SafE family protein [Gimibacter soli]|uniref:Probable membrane transporter protein n=1 Tax=Gimibacter soli TaxID=3024400 RepID=A0AAE9XSP4_9PROT|nr:sulfite exporter TauE/SafE family protein [Gimibacter soli]WCL53330.1 sulfite exporter TauE/SafE family protein [Gimibacter soli]
MDHSLGEQLIEALPLLLMMISTGLAGGILAGLLGVGGGIVIVPVMEVALGLVGVDPAIRMHVAVATSLSTIMVTSVSSAKAHHRKGAIDLDVTRLWAAPILIGSAAGVVVASQVSSGVLSLVFGGIAALVTLKMILPLDGKHITSAVPRGIVGMVPPAFVGLFSSMMGIGGGTLSVPAMTLMGQPIHRAVGTASLFGLLISVPATIGFILTGWGDPRLPAGSLGFVNAIGFLVITPATWVAAPWGAKLAHAMTPRHLSIAFGCFLAIVAARMLYRAALTL